VHRLLGYLVGRIVIRIKETIAIVALQPAFGAYPQIAFFILVQAIYKIGGQPVFGRKMIKNILLR
jgi:hypothetical protein